MYAVHKIELYVPIVDLLFAATVECWLDEPGFIGYLATGYVTYDRKSGPTSGCISVPIVRCYGRSKLYSNQLTDLLHLTYCMQRKSLGSSLLDYTK